MSQRSPEKILGNFQENPSKVLGDIPWNVLIKSRKSLEKVLRKPLESSEIVLIVPSPESPHSTEKTLRKL